jgi:hypothetical protein
MLIKYFRGAINMFHIFIPYNTLRFTQRSLFYIFPSCIQIFVNFETFSEVFEYNLNISEMKKENSGLLGRDSAHGRIARQAEVQWQPMVLPRPPGLGGLPTMLR